MDSVERHITAVKCPDCGGYAEQVDCTEAEINSQSCGRGHECCIRAFVCCLCARRTVTSVDAPEME